MSVSSTRSSSLAASRERRGVRSAGATKRTKVQRAAKKIGYARTSTLEQAAAPEVQLRDLKVAGLDKIFSEQFPFVDAARPQLEAALDFIREGDVLVVTKIDRLARSVGNPRGDRAPLHLKGASLQIFDPSLEAGTSMGAGFQHGRCNCSVRA